MRNTKIITTTLILGLITFWGCEDTTGPEENSDLPKISSLTFEQGVSCSRRYGAAAVSYNNDIYLIGGWYIYEGITAASGTIQKLDNINNQWITLNHYSTSRGRRYLTAEVINDIIYIIGGEAVGYQSTPASLTNVVKAFNITTNSITSVAALPTKRKQLNSVVYDNKIYVIGGELESGQRTGIVEVYDPSSDSWSTLTSMPTARECDIALIEDKIYAFGGYNGSSALTTVEVYDIENDSWSVVNDMPYALSAYHLTSFENFVFLFGDYSAHIDEVNMYNANDDTWIKLSTNFTGRRHAAVVRNDEWIYIIGGDRGSGWGLDIVEKCKPYE